MKKACAVPPSLPRKDGLGKPTHQCLDSEGACSNQFSLKDTSCVTAQETFVYEETRQEACKVLDAGYALQLQPSGLQSRQESYYVYPLPLLELKVSSLRNAYHPAVSEVVKNQ